MNRSPSKLIRKICKQAALMRAPYRGIPWTSLNPPTMKKSLSQNQIQSTFPYTEQITIQTFKTDIPNKSKEGKKN